MIMRGDYRSILCKTSPRTTLSTINVHGLLWDRNQALEVGEGGEGANNCLSHSSGCVTSTYHVTVR